MGLVILLVQLIRHQHQGKRLGAGGFINATGDPVRRVRLAHHLQSGFGVGQDEYAGFRNLKTLGKSPVKEMAEGAQRLAQAARRRLEYFDISAAQIDDLERTGQVKKTLTLASPANRHRHQTHGDPRGCM